MDKNKQKNILLFIGDDFVAHGFLNRFIPQICAANIQPILVKIQSKKPKAFNYKEINRYHFYESVLLNDVIYPHLDDLGADHETIKSQTPSMLAEQYDLQVIEIDNVNDPDFVNQVASMNIIGGISVRCFQIFKKPIIDILQDKGFFCNSHPGLLPYHKGVFCMMRGIVNGHKHLGWTLHEIDEGIDTGQIIYKIPIQAQNEKNQFVLYQKSAPLLAEAWIDYITSHVDHGYVESYKQKMIGEYFTYPTESEMDQWLSSNALDPIDTKTMVSFYYDMFIPETARHTQFAQDFRTLIINKASQFETYIDRNTTPCEPLKQSRAA